MSHAQQIEFLSQLRGAFPSFFRSARVLEIGSLDVNGSVRKLFEDARPYIGLDIGPGPGVDVVCQGQDYDAPDGSFDTVVSCEVMEHNPHWAATIANMIRLCRPGGLLVMTCATTGRREHGTARTIPENSPLTVNEGWTYYGNLTERKILRALPLGQLLQPFTFYENWSSPDLYLIGFKQGAAAPTDAGEQFRRIRTYYRRVNRHPRCLAVRLSFELLGEEFVWACSDRFKSYRRSHSG